LCFYRAEINFRDKARVRKNVFFGFGKLGYHWDRDFDAFNKFDRLGGVYDCFEALRGMDPFFKGFLPVLAGPYFPKLRPFKEVLSTLVQVKRGRPYDGMLGLHQFGVVYSKVFAISGIVCNCLGACLRPGMNWESWAYWERSLEVLLPR